MKHEDFITECKAFIGNSEEIELADIFMVWSCKTLQNSKALFSFAKKGAPYYEMTLDGDKKKIYVDCYHKDYHCDIDAN